MHNCACSVDLVLSWRILMKDNQCHGEIRTQLEKNLSPLEVTALALGAIVGWGCFVLPGIRFLPEAGPFGAVLGFLIGAVFQCIVALNYSVLIRPYPVAGGAFAYAYAGFGSKGAFICGWALVLSYVCVIAANATALILLTRYLLPGVLDVGHLYSIADWEVNAGEVGFVSAILLLLGYMNYKGVSAASAVQVFLAIALTLGILVLAGGTAISETASFDNLKPFFNENRGVFASVLMVLALTPWLFVGFDTIPQTAEEFNFSPHKARDLMIISIAVGAVLYSAMVLAVAGYMPYPELLARKFAWDAGWIADQVFGRFGGIALCIPVLAAILSGMNGFFMASTRLLFSMGRSKFLPDWFAELHPCYGTPWKSTLFILIFTLICPWFGREALLWIVDMSAIGTALAYLFTCMCAYKYLEQHPEIARAAVGKILAVIGCMTSIICFILLIYPSSPASIGIPSWCCLFSWVILGGLFYSTKHAELSATPHSRLRYLLFGKSDYHVLFDIDEDEERAKEEAYSN